MFSKSYYFNYCHKIINEHDRQHNIVICKTKNMNNINNFPNNNEKKNCQEPFSKKLQNGNNINSLFSQSYPSNTNEEYKTININSEINLNDNNINNIPFSYEKDDNSEKEKFIFSGNNNIRLNSTDNIDTFNNHSQHKNINFNNYNPNRNRKKFSNRKNFRNNNYRHNNHYYNNNNNRRDFYNYNRKCYKNFRNRNRNIPNNIKNNNTNFNINNNTQTININNNENTFTNPNIKTNINTNNEDTNDAFVDLACNLMLDRIIGMHISYLFWDDEEDDDVFFNNLGLSVFPLNLVFSESNGVDKKILNNLTKTIIDDKIKLNQDRCVICLDDYKNGDEVIKIPCLHVFHYKCILEWFNNKNFCPICKFELKEDC